MDHEGQKIGVVLLYSLSVILIGIGFVTMYNYGSSGTETQTTDLAGHIVGGDAYNYIIIAVRGLGWITAGLTAAVMGAAASINGGRSASLSHLAKKLPDQVPETIPAQQVS